MRTKKIAMLIIGGIIIAATALLTYLIPHSTYYKYDNWWIVGKNHTEVAERYGEFDIEYGSRKGYYIGDDDAIVMPSHQPMYYWMMCDDSGVVTEVYVAANVGG